MLLNIKAKISLRAHTKSFVYAFTYVYIISILLPDGNVCMQYLMNKNFKQILLCGCICPQLIRPYYEC